MKYNQRLNKFNNDSLDLIEKLANELEKVLKHNRDNYNNLENEIPIPKVQDYRVKGFSVKDSVELKNKEAKEQDLLLDSAFENYKEIRIELTKIGDNLHKLYEKIYNKTEKI